jgi:asparagine synthase (glutamine-hydrolysing)
VSRVLARHAPQGQRLLEAAADPEGLYRGLLRLQPLRELSAVLGPLLADAARPLPRPGPANAREAMADDAARYLPDDLLVKEDRALMAHGVEGRHPFLDGRVRRAARDLDHRGSLGRGRQKQVLRAFVRAAVDPDLARVAKRGFGFPVDAMYRGPLRALAEEVLLGRSSRERGWLSPAGTRRVLQDHLRGARDAGQTLHALVMLELWARRVLDGHAPPHEGHRRTSVAK